MRLICTIHPKESPDENPFAFSLYLKKRGIENEVEEVSIPEEEPFFRIWVHDEDKIEEGKKLYEEFRVSPLQDKYQETLEKKVEESSQQETRGKAPYGKVTLLILASCIFLFLWAAIEKGPQIPPSIKGLPEAPLLPKVDRDLLIDYPHAFALRDEFFTLYTPQDFKEKKTPSPEALKLFHQVKETPYWNGLYDRVVHPDLPLHYTGPLFEKIQEGEVWRLFTPALLHFNLLHIFFNVLWFIILGNQIEFRIRSLRYIILILATALFSNVAQYLMSGSFFMGLSGVVVGLAGFIVARQQVAPWEGYLLNRITVIFLSAFVFGMFALQLVLFFLQLFQIYQGNIAIANTAHIVGGVVGYLLGRLKLFSLTTRR